MAAVLVLGAAFSLDARADYWFKVNDAIQIQFLVGSPQIYLRNLNAFDSTVLGCCYNYSIDTTTQDGRNTWATILSAIPQHTGLYLGIPDGQAPGNVSYVGVW